VKLQHTFFKRYFSLEIFIYQAELVSASFELEGIIKDASSATLYIYVHIYTYIIHTVWEIHLDPRVPEELKYYLNSALAEDRQYFSESLGSLLQFLQG
jgi:hypothetical protein